MATMFGLSAGLDMADMAWEVKCREEDMKQRALENERRAIDDSRRSVDEKAQQLKAVSHQSALIAGFSMIVLVEIEIPADLHPVLLVTFGMTTASVVGARRRVMMMITRRGVFIAQHLPSFACAIILSSIVVFEGATSRAVPHTTLLILAVAISFSPKSS